MDPVDETDALRLLYQNFEATLSDWGHHKKPGFDCFIGASKIDTITKVGLGSWPSACGTRPMAA